MYEYIKGIYEGLYKDYVVVENNGIGYKIYTCGSTMTMLPAVGKEVLLYIEQIVREDFLGLYGFLTREELQMFKMLQTVSGVGAKASLSLLSISTVHNLKHALATCDEKTLERAPGIGKKMAARIILELKDKVKVEAKGIEENENINESYNAEALEALTALGYSKNEAEKALSKVDSHDSLEDLIKNSLKQLIRG